MRRTKQKTKEINRSACEELAIYERHFRDFKEVIIEKGIMPGDIYNIDETGFRIRIGGSQWIITLDMHCRHYSPSSTCRDYCTSVEAISGDGEVIAPLIILKGMNILEKWITKTDLPDNYLFGTSDSGYTNDMLSIDWTKHFDHCTRSRTKGVYRLLIFDGFNSHCTKEFLDFCKKVKIIPFTLPAHSSQHLQPLDVVVFQPFKHYHRQAVELATRHGCTNFNKVEFLHAIESIRSKTFKRSTIRSAWRQSGLIPLAPEVVLQKIRRRQTPPPSPERPKTPPPGTIPRVPTPTTVRSTVRFAKKLGMDVIRGIPLDKMEFVQLIRSTVVNANLRQQAEQELQGLQAATMARNQRQTSNLRVVQKGGVITAANARIAVNKRAEKEAELAVKRAAKKKTAPARPVV